MQRRGKIFFSLSLSLSPRKCVGFMLLWLFYLLMCYGVFVLSVFYAFVVVLLANGLNCVCFKCVGFMSLRSFYLLMCNILFILIVPSMPLLGFYL